jgi:hypothetical protein
MSTDPPTQRRAGGQITPIAWMYIIYGLALGAACLAEAEIGPIRLSAIDAVVPALQVVAAIGAILRRPWGRWLCYVFSVLLLPGVPLGTIIGGLMIYQLTIHRDQFRRVPES